MAFASQISTLKNKGIYIFERSQSGLILSRIKLQSNFNSRYRYTKSKKNAIPEMHISAIEIFLLFSQRIVNDAALNIPPLNTEDINIIQIAEEIITLQTPGIKEE